MTATQLQQPETRKLRNLPHLGLVCITFDQQVRFKTTTRTHYLKLSLKDRETKLRQLYQHNLQTLHQALDFCQKHNIQLYRMTSDLFPMNDLEDQIGANILEELSDELGKIGKKAAELKIRMVLHPDQYVVLSSDSADVVKNSIKILENHARDLDLLGLPQSSWSLMNIHGGKTGRSQQLINVIADLPPGIKNRLTLENDEYAYNGEAIYHVCQEAKIPMVFDAHHHICYEKLNTYDHPSVESMLWAARETWTNPDWQLVHISNGEKSFSDRTHSNLISAMPQVYYQVPWIEVEAKHKEQAIFNLRSWWLMRNN